MYHAKSNGPSESSVIAAGGSGLLHAPGSIPIGLLSIRVFPAYQRRYPSTKWYDAPRGDNMLIEAMLPDRVVLIQTSNTPYLAVPLRHYQF